MCGPREPRRGKTRGMTDSDGLDPGASQPSLGDTGQYVMNGGMPVPDYEGLERADDLASAVLEGTDLGYLTGIGRAPVVSRSSTQKVTACSGIPSSSNAI